MKKASQSCVATQLPLNHLREDEACRVASPRLANKTSAEKKPGEEKGGEKKKARGALETWEDIPQ